MEQHRSPLFHLPRELRDEIYNYYVREDEGYIYEPGTRSLRLLNGQTVDIALSYTCKRVALEMNGLVFRVNTLRFNILPQLPDTTSRYPSASLYHHLLEGRDACLRIMLSYAYPLVTREALIALRSRYPGNMGAEKLEQMIIKEGRSGLQEGRLYYIETLDYLVKNDMLHDLVQIIATHPAFERLTSRGYDPFAKGGVPSDYDPLTDDEEDDEDDEDEEENSDNVDDGDDSHLGSDENSTTSLPLYTKETQFPILEWKPALWWIPEKEDLTEVANFVPAAPEFPSYDRSSRQTKPKHYFSAAAATIQFLERLTPQRRALVRRIIIQEDSTSIGLPQTHARGLAPCCIENPNLRIERRVDIWKTVLIPGSEKLYARVKFIIAEIAAWVCEVRNPWMMDLPTGSFYLVLHGPSKEASQQLCDAMIRAAIWQEGAEELGRRTGDGFEAYIAEDFVDVMKAMVRGDIPARFEADMGELWDIDNILREHEGEWPSSVGSVVALRNFEVPNGGWEAARAEYMEAVEWTDRMDGWDLMVEEC